MSKNKSNDYSNPDVRQQCQYKLWIAWLPQYIPSHKGQKTMVYYSDNRRKNKGLDWLIEKAKSLRTEFRVAIIYDNQTREQMYKIPGCDLAYINTELNQE